MLLMWYFSTTDQCFGDAEYHRRGKVHFVVSMELTEVDKCCCVVTVNEAFSLKTLVSCSGVVIHPQTGIVICTSLPFSRFITDPDQLSAEHTFLLPRSFRKKLSINVVFPDVIYSAHKEELSPSRSETVHNKEVSAQLIALVNCLEFEEAFQAVFQETDQWRFHGDEEDRELMRDVRFLSWFAVLKISEKVDGLRSESIPWQSCSSLQKGQPVIACGSPFGSLCLDLFINTLSRGIISNLAGEDSAVILTDARCLPGTEGGGVFVVKSTEHVHLIGVVVSPFCWKANEWIGLTLVCSVQSIFRSILRCVSLQGLLQDVWLNPVQAGLCLSTTADESGVVKYPTVCLVESGSVWGSGVAVTPQLVVTCRHVVNGKSTVILKFHHKQRWCTVRRYTNVPMVLFKMGLSFQVCWDLFLHLHQEDGQSQLIYNICGFPFCFYRFLHIIGDVLFSTKPSSPYDLALVQMRDSVTDAVTPRMAERFNQGLFIYIFAKFFMHH